MKVRVRRMESKRLLVALGVAVVVGAALFLLRAGLAIALLVPAMGLLAFGLVVLLARFARR